MSDIEIPPHLAELQRTATAAFAAIGRYAQEVNKPALDWTQEESEHHIGLSLASVKAAEALRKAIDAAGMELGNGFEFQRALKQAARKLDEV